jgi:salicylate hydroxylase
MTTQPLSVAIVGGGIAGLTLAHGLLKSNLYPTIFERDASLREIGAGIGFTPNAERAMKLLDPHIHAAFKRVTVQNGTDWFMWVDGSAENEGSVIHKMYLGERGFEGCARADFLDEVSKDLPANMTKFGKKLERIIDEDGTDGVVLEFADGTRTCADVGEFMFFLHSPPHIDHRLLTSS